MPEKAVLDAPEPAADRFHGWVQLLLLAIFIGMLYFRIVEQLILQWWNDPNYSHGFLIPLFSAFVLWKQRGRLTSIPAKTSWWGLAIVSSALLILIAGNLGAELFISRSSLLILFAGLFIYFRGWAQFRVALFAWCVLFLMIPLPAIIFNAVALPLQFLASRIASDLLGAVGVPVLRDGNTIQLPSMTLEVVDACSGIRSLVSLLAIAVMYGYFAESSTVRRSILVLFAIPIAVLANGVRIMGTGLLGQYWSPEKAQGFFHAFSGWVIFVLAIAMLFLVSSAISWPIDFRKFWRLRRAS
ncbi:MAG: exosortase [Candidatus Acidiferrales bacterium]